MNITLETARLMLRRFTVNDVDDLVELDADPTVMRYINGGQPSDREAIQNMLLPKFMAYNDHPVPFGYWFTTLKENGKFIGWFQFVLATDNRFACEQGIVTGDEICLGYRLKHAYWGQGYATEGATRMVDLGFHQGTVKKVSSWALTANRGSTRVMEKAGLTFEQAFEFTAEQLPNLTTEERQAVKYSVTRTH